MAPFFATVKSFADVPITDQGVSTLAFLQASDGVVRLFKMLQSPAFAPVVNDIDRNITKVRTRYLANTAKSTTLELLVQNENAEKKQTATEGLMWLLRGLSFTHQSLHVVQSDPMVELGPAFSKGYEKSLKPHHNFIVQGIFSVAMNACPSRKDFFAKLATDPDSGASVAGGHVSRSLDKWLHGLDTIVSRMRKVYRDNGYGEI